MCRLCNSTNLIELQLYIFANPRNNIFSNLLTWCDDRIRSNLYVVAWTVENYHRTELLPDATILHFAKHIMY
jgi:hypothetical protein